MNDPQRMKELNEAWKIIDRASHEELAELFHYEFSELDKIKDRFEEPDNRFNSYENNAWKAMDYLRIFYERLTGYNIGWAPERYLMHCCYNAGRRQKYSSDTRETNCIFISMMVHRGSSETQAMKLLMRLSGDEAMTSGHLRELQDSFRDFKKIGRPDESDVIIRHNAVYISQFLEFSISNLEGEEKASQKAVEAFRSFFQELIDLMKANHGLIASRDSSYPEIFGPVIDWVNSEYEDPLDYFYTHESHKSVPFHTRRRALNEYINTMYAFSEHPLE